MNLLIVDDEALTRQGLIASIDWKELHIDKIYQADDGIHGLDLAKRCRPEIILCDVRMPRMDGIRMAEALSEILPDTAVIFMSGYSDKEYLKAAIKLKAISYVEKPLDPAEIREAVLEAAGRIEEARARKQSDSRQKTERLALLLTHPWHAGADTDKILREFPLPVTERTWFTSIIIKAQHPISESEGILAEAERGFSLFLEKAGLSCMFLLKHEQHMVFHLFGSRRPADDILKKAAIWLRDHFASCGNLFLAVGNPVCGIEHAYDSYALAVILIHRSFFYEYGAILTPKDLEDAAPAVRIFQDPVPRLQEALSASDQTEASRVLEDVYSYFRTGRDFLPNQIRDIYYQMFLCLQAAFSQAQVSPSADPFRISGIMALMEKCDTLSDLHHTLLGLTETFFREASKNVQENSTIFLIRDFISKHYKNPALSVKDISDHVYLSTSYVCTLFKAETGQTLNQYITEYRMEKAKKLLSDPRYKITDISAKVGYADGNYFGKSFKKIVGLSPSEYREKILK